MSVRGDKTTVCGAFKATASAFADRPAIRSSDRHIDWTWHDYASRVRAAAAGLHGLGLAAGDTLAYWLSDRPELHVVDSAAMHLGAASCALHPACTVAQAEHVLRDTDARIIVTEEWTAEAASALRAHGHTSLETIVVVDEGSTATMLSWAELLACAPARFDLDRRLAAIRPSDVATLHYRFDATDGPRRVELTHGDVVSRVAELSQQFGLPEGTTAVSSLPMTHVDGLLVTHYLPMFHGWCVTAFDRSRPIEALLAEAREHRGFDPLAVAIIGSADGPSDLIEFWRSAGLTLLPLG